jgi:outer membrane protein TolC
MALAGVCDVRAAEPKGTPPTPTSPNATRAPATPPQAPEGAPLPSPRAVGDTPCDPHAVEFRLIDLGSALRLAGVDNPQILLARQRVVLAVANRQLAAAQALPNLNGGLNFDAHTGSLMQASGRIIKVDRDALYVGGGANAVAAGTVGIPAVVYNFNLSNNIFAYLQTRQLVEQQRLLSIAVRNEMLRRVVVAYLDLLRAEAQRTVAILTRNQNAEVARLTAANVGAGTISPSDADRAATELAFRNEDVVEAEADARAASAVLVELLNLDPAVRLIPAEDHLVPMPLVPDPISLPELLTIALVQRPELGAQQAAIRQSLLALQSARVLPFSPNIIMGFSGGAFGGGSQTQAGPPTNYPRFGEFAGRSDFDVVMYWSLQNMGVGNRALIRAADSRLSIAQLERVAVLNDVREQVASAHIRTRARFDQMNANERAVRTGNDAFAEDMTRVRGGGGLPLELLESLRLLGQARLDYVDGIVAYNQAQLELYVALGQPPADMLARPAPKAGVPDVFAPPKP